MIHEEVDWIKSYKKSEDFIFNIKCRSCRKRLEGTIDYKGNLVLLNNSKEQIALIMKNAYGN
jgi:hypothetical protein